MSDDPSTNPVPATTTPAGAVPAVGTPYLQLTQARVALDDAGEAFTVPDESGRLPIVVLPKQPLRIRNEFVIIGVIALAAAFLVDLDLAVRSSLIGIGGLLVFLGVFQSFIVGVPEGARAMLLKSGRYWKTVGAGRHVVPPWIVVSHVVTVREIPFASMALDAPTSDDVRIDMDLLMTFTIAAPERFVFAISAPDFDQVCQAACLDAIRVLVRAKRFDEILDLAEADTEQLRGTIGAAIETYGVEIQRVVVTNVQPPRAFMASRESRRLAAVQRDEQSDRYALQERLQADRDSLKRHSIAARQERIELKAANEALRLKHLEARLSAFPNAARHDVDQRRLDVAKALAGNTRAMVQVGPGGDVADALIVQTLADAEPPAPPRSASRSTKS